MVISFIYGGLKLVLLVHKLCKHLLEQHQLAKTTQSYIKLNPSLQTYNSFNDTNSDFENNSSRRSSDSFVVTSWQSLQVKRCHL